MMRLNCSSSTLGEVTGRSDPVPAWKRRRDQGVALVITLLLLFLMSVIGLAAVLTASSDLLINGYYSNYRGSFYAADSGINIARQAMYNQVSSAFSTNFGTFVSPPPAPIGTLSSTVQTYITNNYGGGGPCLGNPTPLSTSTTCYLSAGSSNPSAWANSAGVATNSWNESFQITNVALTPVSGYNPYTTYAGSSASSYDYMYQYSITAVGAATGAEKSTVTETGYFNMYVAGTPSSYSTSFAIYGAFITNYPPCLGALVPGTMTGPMFTDGAWEFETGTYLFTDPVGQANADADYWTNSGCNQVAASSYKDPKSGQVVAPTFEAGFNLNQPSIQQPANSYSQAWAAIDGKGTGEANAQPQISDLNTDLKTVTGAAWPPATSPQPSSGVYVNYEAVNNVATLEGGGLYIQGNASIELQPSGSSAQVYKITQGGVVTTMTVDPVANTTVLQSGTNSLTLSGVPTNTSVSPPQAGTMIYVNGAITGLTGPGEGQGAIQNGTAVTITANGDVDITGDVRYVTEPVTTTQNQIPNTPVDTLISGNNNGQDLGIFTANGNIVLSSPYADKNLQVDGSQAALGQGCTSCGFLVNGCINTFNNVGGQIQTNIYGACMNTENTYYDRRYNTVPGFAPPWFPSTTINNSAASLTTPPTLTQQRTQWVSSSGQ